MSDIPRNIYKIKKSILIFTAFSLSLIYGYCFLMLIFFRSQLTFLIVIPLLVMGIVFYFCFIRYPMKITIIDQYILFKSILRTQRLLISDIKSISENTYFRDDVIHGFNKKQTPGFYIIKLKNKPFKRLLKGYFIMNRDELVRMIEKEASKIKGRPAHLLTWLK